MGLIFGGTNWFWTSRGTFSWVKICRPHYLAERHRLCDQQQARLEWQQTRWVQKHTTPRDVGKTLSGPMSEHYEMKWIHIFQCQWYKWFWIFGSKQLKVSYMINSRVNMTWYMKIDFDWSKFSSLCEVVKPSTNRISGSNKTVESDILQPPSGVSLGSDTKTYTQVCQISGVLSAYFIKDGQLLWRKHLPMTLGENCEASQLWWNNLDKRPKQKRSDDFRSSLTRWVWRFPGWFWRNSDIFFVTFRIDVPLRLDLQIAHLMIRYNTVVSWWYPPEV